jgi:cobalt-zinc-cadmium efflux system outer membrane protein
MLPPFLVLRWARQVGRLRLACAACLACLAGLLGGCAILRTPTEHPLVAGELHQRTGHVPAAEHALTRPVIPSDVCLDDGLSEHEAITLALWNNAAFRELLVDLKVARADVIQAGLLPNPELWLLPPLDVKQLEYAIEMPLEVFWLRPTRLKIARSEAGRTAETLVQAGLNLIRDVRTAYADLLFARERLGIGEEAVTLRSRIAALTQARLKAGDATPLEDATARADALLAKQELTRLAQDVPLAEERLRNLLGLGQVRLAVQPSDAPLPAQMNVEPGALVEEAMQTRPDAVALQHAVAAADERVRLARHEVVRFLGIIDANGQGVKGFEIGPGFRVTLPLWNWNQGRIARAEAELERALKQQDTLRDRIILDIRQAHTQYLQARQELERLQQEVKPAVEQAIRRAEKAYREGGASLFLVLETTRQLLDLRAREAQLHANVRRALAELERSVGRRLDVLSLPIVVKTGAKP